MKTASSNKKFQITRTAPAYRQIAAALREKIIRGELAPGAILESTEELAQRWNSSYFTVHTALKLLVKEGLLDRIHGSGTSVRERSPQLSCVGIYFGSNVWLNQSAFQRTVCHFLQEHLTAGGVKSEIFVDTRSKAEQGTLLPSLQRAMECKEIQCLIAPLVTPAEAVAIKKLPIPMAIMSATANRRQTSPQIDMRQFWRGAFAQLIAQGCKTMGLISGMETVDLGSWSKFQRREWNLFREEAEISGLETRQEWLFGPDELDADRAKFGYQAFRKLWKQSEKPEGLIVMPDEVVRGVVPAILEAKVKIPEQLKCVFHRNEHLEILCPFPTTWGVMDEEKVALDLIRIAKRQFEGKPAELIGLPFDFKTTEGI